MSGWDAPTQAGMQEPKISAEPEPAEPMCVLGEDRIIRTGQVDGLIAISQRGLRRPRQLPGTWVGEHLRKYAFILSKRDKKISVFSEV